ncbi:pirin family protein [Nocardia wallacei]|uniref:pirin family protein n=1 Tax=Nocardia wallacei TaxID=480035 RepID=UPI0024587490|nr:pirin-like C-terminal cupin domain-containing protein [Nocardia wallacei]
MTTAAHLPGRAVAAVRDRIDRGPSGGTDNSALVIAPGNWAATDPFLQLAENWFGTAGFDWHPLRGFDSVTYVVDGALEHRDNRGGRGVLESGDVQWLTAGRGMLRAQAAHRGRPVHTLQLGLNLPAADKFAEPSSRDLRGTDMPVRTENGALVRVFAGRSGDIAGPHTGRVPVTLVEARIEPGHTLNQDIPAGQRGFAYLLDGSGRFGTDGATARAGQVVHLEVADAETSLSITSDAGLRVLLCTGSPLAEPVVAYGPFVMNTDDQIRQTLIDYKRGVFGPFPAA